MTVANVQGPCAHLSEMALDAVQPSSGSKLAFVVWAMFYGISVIETIRPLLAIIDLEGGSESLRNGRSHGRYYSKAMPQGIAEAWNK